MDKERMNEITNQVIGSAFCVSNALGCGFLEKVHENALAHELRKRGFSVEQQHKITVYYDGVVVGEYTVDLFVERAILVELKAVAEMVSAHAAQCMNYLKATGANICLLINFGKPKVEIQRVVLNF